MAKRLNGISNAELAGVLVFSAADMSHIGIIQRVIRADKYGRISVEVEWLNETVRRKKVTTEYTTNLRDFMALVEEHRRNMK